MTEGWGGLEVGDGGGGCVECLPWGVSEGWGGNGIATETI